MSSALSAFVPPYRSLQPFSGGERELHRRFAGRPGASLLWRLDGGAESHFEMVRGRPGGVALIVMLPAADRMARDREILRIVERCRPHSVLPHHEDLDPAELRQLARRPPDDLAAEVTDYLAWRGVAIDSDTRHLVRRTIDMSAEIRTVAALARGLYQSRRALGRRLLNAGLPVASHWLHFGRILRAAIRLQSTDDSLFTVACDLGYPDGFALSNQMKRLTGLRPTTARDYLGWEWILETWLQKEAEDGNVSPAISAAILLGRAADQGGTRRPSPTRATSRERA